MQTPWGSVSWARWTEDDRPKQEAEGARAATPAKEFGFPPEHKEKLLEGLKQEAD